MQYKPLQYKLLQNTGVYKKIKNLYNIKIVALSHSSLKIEIVSLFF